MTKLNNVGLDIEAMTPVVEGLSSLLADYQVFYTNLRGLHWLIEGDNFFDLHPIYEEYYNEFAETIDGLAERILMLGGIPESRFSQYLQYAEIKELSGVRDWKVGVSAVIKDLQASLVKLHKVQELAIKAKDTGTVNLLVHYIRSAEKKIWMLSVYIK